ncbi:MAG: DMT family transporter [Acidobacteriota bacterium]
MNDGSSSPWKLYLIVVGVYLFWGANFIFSKIVLREMPGLVAASLRTVLAAALMLPVYWWSVRRGAPAVKFRELPIFLFLGSVGIAINQACFLIGLAQTSAGNAALVISFTPILVLFLAAAVGQERITPLKLVGLAVAIGGVVLLQQGHEGGASSWVGDLFMLAAGASFAVYTVFGKHATRRHGAIPIIAFSYAAGALTMWPFTYSAVAAFDFGAVSTKAWLAFFYMTVVSSTVCYLFFYYALHRLASSRISAFAYLQPFVATLLAIPMLGEPLTAAVMGGGTLVLAGVFLTERG